MKGSEVTATWAFLLGPVPEWEYGAGQTLGKGAQSAPLPGLDVDPVCFS
jgi:hypothetical protein